MKFIKKNWKMLLALLGVGALVMFLKGRKKQAEDEASNPPEAESLADKVEGLKETGKGIWNSVTSAVGK